MSSLRDQLLQKGLVTKKQAQRVNRELKDERKVEQAQRKSKSELKAEEDALRAAEEAELVARRKAERDEREARKDALERELRVRNLVSGNRVRPGRGQLFWHRSFTGPELLRVEVSTGMAYELRSGQAGIAALRRSWEATEVEYVVISRKAALVLLELAPEHLVFFVEDVAGISDAAEAFLERRWEASLGARRATAADLERFRRR